MNQSAEQEQVRAAVRSYQSVLNGSDVEGVLALYTDDGVFMPIHGPTSQGAEQLRAAYQYVFSTLDLDVVFNFDEVTIDGDVAVVRTSSIGTVKILADARTLENETHREFFTLKKAKDTWKISRYMFNKATPAPN